MGTSNWQNISYCIGKIRKIKPQSILDIGVGYGRWGILSREFLEVWEGCTYKENWKLRIDGIEAFAKNIVTYHNYFYNNILIGDALEEIDSSELLPDYDLIILGDVLEHFTKENGIKFLEKCIKKGKFVLLIIPLGEDWPQSERDGNIYETHQSVWCTKDLKKYRIIVHKYFNDYLQRKFGVFILAENENLARESFFKKIKRYLWFRARELVRG